MRPGLPIVSLGAASGFDEASSQMAAAAIATAGRDTGFFYVIDHGVDARLMAEQLNLAARFFKQPLELKRTIDIAASPIMRGYEAVGLQTLDPGTLPDLKESLMLGRDLSPDHPLVVARTPMEGANPWPPNLPGFREGVNAYIEAVSHLGRRLARLLARSLELPETYFEAAFAEPNCALRMLRYPPQAAESAGRIGCGAHTDWGFLTILLQDDLGGLEIQTRSGEWIGATPVPDSLIVNLGDMIPVLTNGRYRSSAHRVRNNRSGRDRHSIPIFFNPQYHYDFECAPTCLAPGQAPPPPLSYGDHLTSKFRQTYIR